MQSVMTHRFAEVPRANIPRSSFDRSHGYKTTFDADLLIPVLVDDCVPGDTVNCNMNFFGRLTSPTVLPLMDNMYLESFFFFVPYRLVWNNFEKFHGAQDNPGDSISYTIPVVTGTNSYTGEGSLWDYFGLPLDNKGGAHLDPDDVTVSALPYRAYSLIYDEWFRDQNLQDAYYIDRADVGDDGPDTLSNGATGTNYVWSHPLKRGKRHDYFTSALPWPQKGTAVSLPLGTSAPVTASTETADMTWHINDGGATASLVVENDGNVRWSPSGSGFGVHEVEWDNANSMIADLSTATAATINDLRLAFQTQRLLERDARSGTRYNEMILAHFGVTVPDFRVQRPEYLGGGSSPVNISPVAQTTYQGTQTVEDAKGALSGIGTVSGRHAFTYSCQEHGVLIGLVSVRGDITYSQGIERYWSKQTRYEFYYPVLSQIGEQSILMQEIWTQGDGATTDQTVWGYTERYNEYRYKPSRLTGLMSVEAASNLDEFHLSEDFTSQPALNATFIQSNTSGPLDRAISVPSQPQFVFDAYFQYRWARPMPLYGVPGQLDHF